MLFQSSVCAALSVWCHSAFVSAAAKTTIDEAYQNQMAQGEYENITHIMCVGLAGAEAEIHAASDYSGLFEI